MTTLTILALCALACILLACVLRKEITERKTQPVANLRRTPRLAREIGLRYASWM